jgi:hypothetical protein
MLSFVFVASVRLEEIPSGSHFAGFLQRVAYQTSRVRRYQRRICPWLVRKEKRKKGGMQTPRTRMTGLTQ